MASRQHSLSFSESVQRSLVLGQISVLSKYHHGGNRRNVERQNKQHYPRESSKLQETKKEDSTPDCQYSAGRLGRLFLVSAMFGVDAVMAIEAIYMLLILQYLGCPVYLMSFSGVITGLLSLVLIPVVGQCSNSGNDIWKRKLYALCFGLAFFVSGALLISVSGIMKSINPRDDWTTSLPVNNLTTGSYLNSTESTDNHNLDQSDIPVVAVIGIIGFALSDTAYDASAPIVRSFALETLHQHEHAAVLATSTIMQAFGGSVFSIIGIFDIPHAMETIFGFQDGMSGLILLVYGLIIVVVICSFVATIISAYYLANRNGKRNRDTSTFAVSRGSGKLLNETISDVYGNVGYSRLEDTDSTSHHDLSGSQESEIRFSDKLATHSHDVDHFQNDAAGCCKKEESNENQELFTRHKSNMYGSNITKGDTASSKTKLYIDQKKKCPEDSKATKHFQEEDAPQSKQRNMQFLCNKRLIITAISCFFGNGSQLAIAVYASNTLTIGIYKGDPRALPGTTGRDMYEQGLRSAAFGFLVVYVSSFIGSLCNGKIIQILGEKLYYVVTCTILVTCCVALTCLQTEIVYFVTMVIYGVFRACQLTVPYVLVSKIMTLENGPTTENKDLGRAISLLGLTMPLSYLLLSSVMGPLIDATGNVWVPILYATAATIVSTATLLLLYCVK